MLAGAAAALLALPGAAGAQGPELLPDLQGQRAEDLIVDTDPGVRDLRLTTSVGNGGSGPLEIYPVAGNNCDGDGDNTNNRLAFQRVYHDANGNGFFTRGVDTDSTPYQAGCMVFHDDPTHNHWHFEDFASYELRLPETGQVVAAAAKVSFCAIDSGVFDSTLLGFPTGSYFDTCDEDETEGISVGWEDTYGFFLDGQQIDLNGVPDGSYCLGVTADPSNIVKESNETNNTGSTLITLAGNSVTDLGPPCPRPAVAPPPGVVPKKPAKCKRKKKGKKGAKSRKCKKPRK